MVLDISHDTARKLAKMHGANIYRDLQGGNTILMWTGAYLAFCPGVGYRLCGYQKDMSDITPLVNSVQNDM